MEQRGWKLMNEKKYYTYILRCGDDTLYTGFTTDLEHRLQTHNAGKGAKYTKARLPVEMIYHEEYKTEGRSNAQRSSD